MSNRVTCDNCGGRVDVPAGHTRAKVRCPHCGYYTAVPPDLRGEASGGRPPADDDLVPDEPESSPGGSRPPPAKAKPTKTKAKKPVVVDPGPNLLEGTQDEDDEKPYAVPGDGTKKCPACRQELPIDATFCVHCGGDLAAGVKKKRTFTPIDRTWESIAGLPTRVKAFLGIQAVNALMVANVMATGGNAVAYLMVLFNVALQAFLVGTFDTLTVRRNSKGAGSMVKQWRVCFLPQPSFKVDWKRSHAVGIVAVHDPGLMEWGFLLMLLSTGAGQMAGWVLGHEINSPFMWLGTIFIVFPLALAPPALWYWYVIRPERFLVALTDEFGSTNDTVFRTTDRAVADEICGVIKDATGLWYRPVM
jgi:hypothetical protein